MKLADKLSFLAGFILQSSIILGGFFLMTEGVGIVTLAIITFGMYWMYESIQNFKSEMLTKEVEKQQSLNFDLSNIKIKEKK